MYLMVVKEKFESQLHSSEIEVTIHSSYFPTMKLLDLPGITSGSTDTGIDKKRHKLQGDTSRERQSQLFCSVSQQLVIYLALDLL